MTPREIYAASQDRTTIMSHKHQRIVRISAVLPVSVELLVGTDDDKPSADTDWEILSVRSASCEATPRVIEESMADEDFAALAKAAAKAKDQR